MGTDDLGRDILSGVLQGARTSLMVGFLAVATSASIGLMIGILSGFYGGKIDLILSRVMELFMVIPRFMLGIVLVAIFGATIWNVVAVIGFLMWPEVARVVRSEYLTMKEWLFTEAARADGASNWTLMFSEILPNVVSAIVIITTLQIGNAILLEAGLSFIGAGDPNVPSWGMMLENAQAIFQRAWWTMVFPGLFLSATVLSFNLMGDGLNDALNPRLKISMS
jgi:peptide/nickel transport system permease protein